MRSAKWNKEPIGDFYDLASTRRIRMKDRRVHRNSAAYWPECVRMDQLSREELLALQSERLEDLVKHVVKHVPFYKDWATGAGYEVGDKVVLTDLPIVTKADFAECIDAFQSDAFSIDEMRVNKTSGSSGVPFRFRSHPIASDYSYCCIWRALHRFGLRPGDRRVYLWGRSYSFRSTPLALAKKKVQLKIRDWFNNTLAVDAYDLTFQSVNLAIDRIEKFKPVYLHGYVSALYTIARTLVDDGRTLNVPNLVAVVTESEKVYPFQRETMEQAFGCPILEHYGSVEFGNIAEPDPDGNLRINEDLFIVEREPSGEAVITSLLSHAFPFIRYKLGDLIEIDDEIQPKLPYASFRSIVGRTVDMIPVPAGGSIHGVALAHLIDPHLKYVLKYQIHQITIDRFVVRIVPRSTLPESIVQTICCDLRSLVGQQTHIEVLSVDHIEPAASGKFRWVISNLTSPSAES